MSATVIFMSVLIPFGAQSGRPTAAAASRIVSEMAEAGFTDYLLYARSGLDLDYMGEEWLALTGAYLAAAKAKGLHIWLYDEFNWPSGSCHGRVTAENPAQRSTTMALVKGPDGAETWRPLLARPESANVLDRAAMDRFRELTHAEYERRFSGYFADGTIRGVFSDEPGSLHYVPLPEGGVAGYRWYPGIEADYAAATGRDLRGDVAAWSADRSRNDFWGDYWTLVGQDFRRSFFDPTTAWAKRLGIVTTGHLMDESDPGKAVVCNGDPLHVLKGMSMPAVDEIFSRTGTNTEWLTFASVQHAAGRNRSHAGIELFALGPADLTFAKMRQMYWLAAFHKIDRYILSLAHTSARGFVDKPHYAMFFTPIQPWFRTLVPLHADAADAADCAAKPFRCDVAVRYPVRLIGRLVANLGAEGLRLPLVPLLRTLAWNQVTCDLYEEDEPCDKPVVFTFDETEDILVEGTDLRFKTPDAALRYVRERCPRLGRIDNAPGVLLREYEDGTLAALNLADHGWTNLTYRGEGRTIRFDLPHRGVWRGEGRVERSVVATAAPTSWRLALDSPTKRRIRFDCDNRATLRVRDACEVRFMVCRMPRREREVALDGHSLAADQPCTNLVYGYDADYRLTAPIRLESGEHRLALKGAADDGPFLPALWCVGNFAVEDGALVCRPTAVPAKPLHEIGLADYAGEATYSAEIEIPSGAGELELDVGNSVCRVRLGDRDLGVRGWAPYHWMVPSSCRGRRETLSVTVTTSIRPIFGEREPKDCPAVKMPKWVPKSTDTMGEESIVGLQGPCRWRH